MALPRAKPVDELYDEVREFDLVPDPPLASTLNRRLEEAHFGPFAITPRRLAAGRRETAEDRVAILKVVEETELSWKEAASPSATGRSHERSPMVEPYGPPTIN